MSTTQTPPRQTLLQRFTDWTLDHDGTMYGDERERLRWYEATVVMATVHGFLVPWTLAVLIWVGGRPVAPYLLAVFAAFLLPTLLAAVYVARRQVRVRPERPDRKYVLLAVALNVPYAVFVLGVLKAYLEGTRGSLVGGLVGAVVGGVGAWLVLQGVEWLRTRRSAGAPDPD
jgi:drug/metabolite transporter (DMT)-like permease